MKRLLVLILGLSIACAGVQAQTNKNDKGTGNAKVTTEAKTGVQVKPAAQVKNNPPAKVGKTSAEFDLSENEVAELEQVVEKHSQTFRLAEADLDILKAQIQKELILEKPSMDAIKSLVHQSMVVEEGVRIAQIERLLTIRKILGEERWADMSRWIRSNREMIGDGSGKLKELDPRILALLRILAKQ